jgi:hypothetical protein
MRALYVVVLASLGGAACTSYDYTYKAWVKDPSAVERLPAASAEGVEVAQPTGTTREAIATGVLTTGAATSADYKVYAERGPRGSLSLSVDTRAALAYGERTTLIDGAGLVIHPTFADKDFVPEGPDIHIPYCAALSSARRGYVFGAGPTCVGDVLTQGELVTPRSNVLRVVEERRTHAWAASLGAGFLYVAIVVPIAVPMAADAFESKGTVVAGDVMLGVGAAGVLALIMTALASSDRDAMVYEAPR